MAPRPRRLHLRFLLVALAACSSCSEADELPPIQFQGRFLAYAADDDVEICEGTLTYAEAWMEEVTRSLGMDPDMLLPTIYYIVSPAVLDEECGGYSGCARLVDGHVQIFTNTPMFRHELVHGVHLSVWPRRAPILHEGLAQAFDDEQNFPFHKSYSVAEIDAAIEAENAREPADVYGIGHYIVHLMFDRYTPTQFAQFWHATTPTMSAEDFRVAFQESFGESFDAALADIEARPYCMAVTCVGEPQPWTGEQWKVESPQGCEGDNVYGYERGRITRDDLIEITQGGLYDVSASDHPSPIQGAFVTACDSSCRVWRVWQGETRPVEFSPGVYRVTTYRREPSDPGVRVEIRPSKNLDEPYIFSK